MLLVLAQFGAVLDTFHFSQLPEFSLAGIDYDRGRFYITSLWEGKVYSFSPDDPEGSLREELVLGDYFQDGFQDYFWGIDKRGDSLFVSVVSAALDSAAILLYLGGSLARAWKFDLGGWAAGVSWDYVAGGLWVVQVGDSNNIYLLQLEDSLFRVDAVSGWATSQRGLSFFAPYGLDTARYLLTGNWNEGMLYLVDADDTAHAVVEADSLQGVAGCAVWDSVAGDTVYAFITVSDTANTLYKVSLGMPWSSWVGVAERRGEPKEPLAFLKGERWFAREEVEAFSSSGRFLGKFKGFLSLKPGIYVLRAGRRSQVISVAKPKAP